ncbi:MAG: carbon-nitrogen hydrolase family protein, partial [Acidobacteria bacterium]
MHRVMKGCTRKGNRTMGQKSVQRVVRADFIRSRLIPIHLASVIRLALPLWLFVAASVLPAAAQEMMPPAASGWAAWAPRAATAPATDVTQLSNGYALNVYGNQVPNVYGGWRTRIQGLQGGRYYRFTARAVPVGIVSLREAVTIVLRWRGSFGDEVTPDYVWDYRLQSDGSLLFDRVIQAPAGTTAVDVDLVLQWSSGGRVSFDRLSFTPAAAPAARPVRVAAVYFRPSGASSGLESVRQAARYAEQVAANNRPDVMVLGETLNVIGAPGTLEDKAETIPGPSTDVIANVARTFGVNIAFGLLERAGTQLYNAAVLLDRTGTIVGKYRKVQLPLSEASAGIAPGSSVPVFEADFGRVALLICQDAAFPEPAREAALQGAEMLLVPIWGGKPGIVRARAAEHGLYLAASGYDYASEVIGPLGTVLAGVGSLASPGAAVTDIDLSRRFRETWLGEMRDLASKERRASPYTRSIDEPPTDTPPPPADTTTPAVSLTSPAAGATVYGSLTVAATATDNVGVARVRFLVGGTQLGADDTTAPFSASWDTRTASN